MNKRIKELIICSILESNKDSKPSYLDSNNILWSLNGNKLIGKRSGQTNTLTQRWINDIREGEVIKNYSCGEDADYEEIFIKEV